MRELIERLNSKTGYEMFVESAAQTILDQLGGAGRLKAMIGARDFGSSNGGKTLSFKFPNRARSKPNYIKITLTSLDLYDVEFGRTQKYDYKKLKTYSGIYADQLKGLIEKQTGLYLSL